GTTGMGVGPAYADKVARHGIQAYEIRDERRFRARVAHELETKNAILERFGDEPLDAKAVADEVLSAAATLGERIVDTLALVEHALARDAAILLEGQLGAMRDLDWGMYPYVTSSNPLAGGASVGAGIPPRLITRVIGVVKAYSTAVGEGPFPTELHGREADELRERAGEYGATTGRPRRVGWFDAVAPRHAHRLNAFTEIAVTKLDVLDVDALIFVALAVVAHRWDLFVDLQAVVLPGACLIGLSTATVFWWRARSWTRERVEMLNAWAGGGTSYGERLRSKRTAQ